MGETPFPWTSEHLNARDEILRSIDLHQEPNPHDAALRRRRPLTLASTAHTPAVGGDG